MPLQVALWEVGRHQQLQPKGSAAEKGCSITHAVLAGSGSQQGSAAAYYAISTPGSGTVTIKWLDEQGRSGVVQVSQQQRKLSMPAAAAAGALRAVEAMHRLHWSLLCSSLASCLLSDARLIPSALHHATPACLRCCLQDVGEGLLALLHYSERQQLVAVTSSGSAMILSNSTGSATAAAEWGVLMRVKLAGVGSSAKLQVGTTSRSIVMQNMCMLLPVGLQISIRTTQPFCL